MFNLGVGVLKSILGLWFLFKVVGIMYALCALDPEHSYGLVSFASFVTAIFLIFMLFSIRANRSIKG